MHPGGVAPGHPRREPGMDGWSFGIRGLRELWWVHQSLLFRLVDASDGQDAVDAIRPEDAELALIVTAEIDEAAPARTGAS
jgi:hypothetical protein